MQILIHVDLPTKTERNNNNSSDNPVKSKHKPTDAVSATSQFEFDGENKHFKWKSEGKSRSKSKSSESFSFLASDADPYQRQESWGLIGRYRAGIIFSFDESKEHAKHNRLLRQDELNSWIVQFVDNVRVRVRHSQTESPQITFYRINSTLWLIVSFPICTNFAVSVNGLAIRLHTNCIHFSSPILG